MGLLSSLLGSVTGSSVLSSLASIGSSLLTNSSNSSSVSDTNSTNYAIAQMNNEYNEELLEKQLQYNWDMWEADNEYNSASSQVERYLEAGLNPAIMMTSGSSAGTASSISAPSAAPASEVGKQIPTQYDYSGIGEGVSAAVNSAYQNQLVKNQADQVGIENKFWAQKLVETINNLKSNTRNQDSQADLNYIQKFILNNTKYDVIEQARLQNEEIRQNTNKVVAETNYIGLQGELLKKNIKWYDQKAQVELSKFAADTYELYSRGHLNYAQAELAIANKFKVAAETDGIKINNFVARSTAKDLIKQCALTTKQQQADYDLFKLEHAMFSPNSKADEYALRFINTASFLGKKINPLGGLIHFNIGK